MSNNENKDKNVNNPISGRKFKSGAYVSIISAIVIVLVLLVNLIITEFDLKIDLSSEKIYTLTDESKEYIKKIEDDVTIYYLIEAGKEAVMLQKIAEKFDSLSNRISLEQKDPIQYPGFASEYVDDEIELNSFLVVNNKTKQAKYINYEDMLVKEFNQQTLKFNTIGVDIEGKLISAIQYVTNPNLPTVYYTVGHDEIELGSVFGDILARMNIAMNPLQTLTMEQVPEDCDVLIVNAPSSDLSDTEAEKIKEYMAAGGNAVIVMDYLAQDLKNLNSIINYYGIQMEKGIICEADTNHHVPLYPRYIVPKVLEHDLTKGLDNSNQLVVTPTSSGLVIMDNIRSSTSIEPLLRTSDNAYSKINLNPETLLKEDGDIDGPFYVGIMSTDTYEGITSSLVVYTSSMVFNDNMLTEFGNFFLLVNTMGNLVEEMETISVRPRYLYPMPLNITQKPVLIWAGLAVIGVPVLVLAIGIVIVVRRRRR